MEQHNHPNAMLTLAIPSLLEEEMIDFLLLHPEWANGFSIMEAQGMGSGASLVSAMEKVQGRCRRTLILIVGVQNELEQLLAVLKEQISHSDVAYWFTPVTAFGRL